jgi:hypothetical protein
MRSKFLIKKLVLDEEKRFSYYEKLYFYELDLREKLHARVGFPLTIVLSQIAAIVYLAQAADFTQFNVWKYCFACLLLLSLISAAAGALLLWRSFWGHTYVVMPTAREVDAYRLELEAIYENFPTRDELVNRYFKEFLTGYIIERATQNAVVNEVRALSLHRANLCLALAAMILFIASFVYYGVLHKKEPILFRLVSPNEFSIPQKVNDMDASSQPKFPPPPPPPPPPREIKEGVRNPPPPPPPIPKK